MAPGPSCRCVAALAGSVWAGAAAPACGRERANAVETVSGVKTIPLGSEGSVGNQGLNIPTTMSEVWWGQREAAAGGGAGQRLAPAFRPEQEHRAAAFGRWAGRWGKLTTVGITPLPAPRRGTGPGDGSQHSARRAAPGRVLGGAPLWQGVAARRGLGDVWG